MSYVTATSKNVLDIKPEDTYWCAADIGWITGHSYIVYGPLSLGTTSVMYEDTPDHPHKGRIWGDSRALRRGHLPHVADRSPDVHEVGRATSRTTTSTSGT